MAGKFEYIDTSIIDSVIARKDSLLTEYDGINADYERIVKTLMTNWVGDGAEEFAKDAETVRRNIVGIYDMLKIMCDTLTDCKEIIAEADKALGDYNINGGEGEV